MKDIALVMLPHKINIMEVGCSIWSSYVTCIDYNISVQNHIVMFDKNEDKFNATFEIMASK